jgi:DNA-binding NtrC family response regulator
MSSAAAKSPGPSIRVLVVDDDAGVRNFLRMLLELEGYEVATVGNGIEALETQRQAPAAIVLTDIFMPDGEGMETIVQLRQEFPQARIIVMSGGGTYNGVDYLKLARELGAVKALKKPFPPQDLIDAMREISGPQPPA